MAKPTSRANFTLVWQPFRGASPTNRCLGPSEVISFPYIVEGEACAAMHAGQRVELTGIGLLHGILVGYREVSPFTDISKPHLREALDDLVQVFRAPSLDIMLLDASAYLRDRYGAATALTALETAMDIVPQSSMVRNDLVLTTWACYIHIERRAFRSSTHHGRTK